MHRAEKPIAIAIILLLALVLTGLIVAAPPPDKSADFASWAQVGGTMLAIVGSVFAGYLHADRQSRIAEAERFKAAYLLTRAAGSPVIDVERWLRAGALDVDQVERDWKRVRRYREAWPAWIHDRYDGYLESLEKLDILTLADGAFIDNVLSVRSRLKWLGANVSQHVGLHKLDKNTEQRLSWAARDVINALAEMRERADLALDKAGLPKISQGEAKPFPNASPSSHLKESDRLAWEGLLARV